MIQLTRLNNSRLALNCDLIKYVEEAPDTVITLLSGEKLVVRETTTQVIDRVRDFRRSVLSSAGNWLNDSAASVREGGQHAGAAPGTEEPARG